MTASSATVLRRWLPTLVVLVIGLLIPLFTESGFELRIAMLVWIYAVIGMAFNLLFGFAGQLSLGQQGFFALGGYAIGLVQAKLAWPLEAALLSSMVICALVGLLLGVPVLRLRSHYFAMATLMFGLIVEGVALRWFDLTGGSAGVHIVQPRLLGVPLNRYHIYYLVFGIAVITFVVQALIISSHIGRALQSLRDDEPAAQAMGIDVTAYKVKIFILAAVLSGLAGSAYSLVGRHVDPSYSSIQTNVNLLTIAVVGGLGTYIGPTLGAFAIVLAPQVLVRFHTYEALIYGASLLLFMLFLPRGLAGLIEGGGTRLFRRRSAPIASERPLVAPASTSTPAILAGGE
jgi:branched-chain amino acid transport system permease protein